MNSDHLARHHVLEHACFAKKFFKYTKPAPHIHKMFTNMVYNEIKKRNERRNLHA